MRVSFDKAALLVAVAALFLALGAGNAAGVVSAPAGGPVHSGGVASALARFNPVSASFVSGRAGFVLGARGCAKPPCPARLVKTADGGRIWAASPAPPVPVVGEHAVSPPRAVSTVRFASRQDGWLFGPGLWATHDGGRHWRRIFLHGTVGAVAASAGVAFASVSPAGGGPARLYQSRVGTNHWTLVPGVVPGGALTLYGHSGWAGSPPHLWATADLRHWHTLSFRCPAPYTDSSSLAVGTATRIAILCAGNGAAGSMGKLVFASADRGRTFHRAGLAPLPGIAGTLAIPAGQPRLMTLATSSAASMLDRSVNGGRTWREVRYLDGGLGWRDVAYISATTGWLVHGNLPAFISHNELMRTVNAGASWLYIAIP